MITSAKPKNHQTVSWHLNDLKTHFSQYMASLKNAFRNDTKSINFSVSNKQNTQQKPKNNHETWASPDLQGTQNI